MTMSDVLNLHNTLSSEKLMPETYFRYKVCSLQSHTKIYFLVLSNLALYFCTISDPDTVLLKMILYLVAKAAQSLLCVSEKMLSL